MMLLMASGIWAELNETMQLVEMPNQEMRVQLMGLLIFDLLSTVMYSALLRRIFAIKPVNKAKPLYKNVKSAPHVNGSLKAE